MKKKTLNNRRQFRHGRQIALILITALFCSLSAPLAEAAPPSVSVDEALYVNLDYYGAPQAMSVVKGCNLNGVTEFTDFGSYESVTNMSNHAEPDLSDQGITWKLPQDAKSRFYFECTPKAGTISLPWSFDVSYQLDGVPIQAEKLAGASGLVEINIACAPNKNAPAYYQNNMLLQAAVMVNMEDVKSLEAPGSQLQSIGTYKAAVFAALPGEETTFTLRIGADDFECSGIILMMIPGTLEQMKDIKELKEAKDTLKDSADAIYAALNELFTLLSDLSSGLSQTSDGLAMLNTARESLSSSKAAIYESADAALAGLTELSGKIDRLLPSLTSAQELAADVESDLRALSNHAEVTANDLSRLSDSLGSVGDDLGNLDLGSLIRESRRKDLYDKLDSDLSHLESALNLSFGTLRDAMDSLDSFLIDLESNLQAADNLTSSLRRAAKRTGAALDSCGEMLQSVRSLSDTLGSNTGDLTSFLDDARELGEQLSGSVSDVTDFLSLSEAVIKDTGENLDRGAETTLDGLIDMLSKGLASAGKTPRTLKYANSTVKRTLDDQVDKFEEENKLLNLDAESRMLSFTSPDNPEPDSIQILVRTQEISKDSAGEDLSDYEKTPAKSSLLDRIASVFQKIWGKITALFQ